MDDECSCRVSKKVYYPKENVLYELSERNREFMAWYRAKGDGEEEYFVGGPHTEYAKVVVDHNKDFKEIEVEELRKSILHDGGRVPGVLQLYQWHRSFGGTITILKVS